MNELRKTVKITGRTALITALLLAFTAGFHFLSFTPASNESDLDHLRNFNDGYKVFSLTLPNELTFCGEQVPLQRLDVRERLDRELLVNTYWQSNTLLAHKRSNRWFPLIEKVLRHEGVPEDLKYLAVIESGLTNVVSPAGAAGYWQFMKDAAGEYGLEVNSEVDERYHVEKSTIAAAKYLKAAYKKHNSWALAAASYNLGMGGVNKQITRQKKEDYYDLLLTEETSRYVFRIIAMKEIIQDPERYGFHLRKKDLYPPYDTRSMEITGPIEDIADFAIRQGTDYKTVKLLNPWLRDTKLTNREGRTYVILLPGEAFDTAGIGVD